MAQSIFSNAVVATVGRSITLVCGLAATALMTRMMAVEAFGMYSLVLTVAIMLQLVADFGLYLVLSRELGVSEGKQNNIIANIVSLRLALLGTVFICALIVFFVVPSLRTMSALFLVLALGLIFQSASQLLMSVFQAYGCVWRATVGDVIGRMSQIGMLAVGFVYAPYSNKPLWVASAFTIGLMLSWLIHVFFVPEKRLLRIKISASAWKKIIGTSWPIALMLILNVIYFRVDIVILSYVRSNQEVGLYSLAYKIIENGLFFPAMIGGLLLPAVSSALVHKEAQVARGLISQGLTLSFSGACILVAVLIVYSKEVVLLLGGVEFLSSAALLQVLAIALGSMFLGNIFGFGLIAAGQQKKLLVLYAVLAVLDILLNLVLIPQYGALGAAWVTVATEVSATVTAGYLLRSHVAWVVRSQKIISMMFLAIVSVMIPAFLLTHMGFLVQLAVACAIYILAMHGMGVWSKASLSILRSGPLVL